MKKILIAVVKSYRKIVSPYKIRSCRFEPSCSAYAQEALEKYGVIWGGAKAFWRVARCHPFSRGGYDPVEKGPAEKI